jgi:hypothetical protein
MTDVFGRYHHHQLIVKGSFMKRQTLTDLLAAHADALNQCEKVDDFDSDSWLSACYPSEVGQYSLLFQLAQALKQALVPVQTPLHFKSDLGRRLAQSPRIVSMQEKRPIHWILLIGAAIVGAILIVLKRFPVGHNQSKSQAMSTAA